MRRIKKDDLVFVTTGRDKGAQGRVLRILGDGQRVLVEGVNVVKRHTKPDQFQQGGIVEKESPIHISNIMHFDTTEEKPTRIKAGQDKDGKKVRISVLSGTVID